MFGRPFRRSWIHTRSWTGKRLSSQEPLIPLNINRTININRIINRTIKRIPGRKITGTITRSMNHRKKERSLCGSL